LVFDVEKIEEKGIMKSEKKSGPGIVNNESGVALVTVVMISVLLLIACIAILSAVGSHSKNVTDVLSESKAYYAAESGLQTTINVLRGNTSPFEAYSGTNQEISYKRATKPVDSNLSSDPNTAARLSRWINYNYQPTGASTPDRVVIGNLADYTPNSGVAYKVEVSDPDNTQDSMTFSTTGLNVTNSSGTIQIVSTTNSADMVEITFTNVTNHFLDFNVNDVEEPLLTTFNVAKVGAGATSGEKSFRINFHISAPRDETVSLRGKAKIVGSSVEITFDSYIYEKVGSEITLCDVQNTCGAAIGAAFTKSIPIPTATGTFNSASVYGKVTAVEPYRLRLLATGYGPNRAMKQLEAIIQRNFFNDLASGSAVAMVGPTGSGFLFDPGNSNNVNYCGVNDADPDEDCEMPPVGTPVATVPSIGLTDPTNYQYVLDHPPPSGYTPPPAMLNEDIPDWQQSPENLDELITDLYDSAYPDTYYPSGVQPPSFGEYDAVNDRWNGITFCDGNCSLNGNGGGILVVTGKLTLTGQFNFKGLIIVTGAGGVDRQGGGNGAIIGNLVIAPYNRSDLAAGFLPPRYDMHGGGNSDVIYSGSSTNFDGQTAISDFMQGVSEK
jgi:hypothetical protein